MALAEKLLTVRNLVVEFAVKDKPVLQALRSVNLEIAPGEIHGLVGESGSGKTVFALSLLRMIEPPGAIVSGEILWQGRNVISMSVRELQAIRGRSIAMVFQDAIGSLNPALTVESQIIKLLVIRRGLDRTRVRAEALRLLEAVQLPKADRVLGSYPHELSGGMAQRVAIAMALSCEPQLLIADEPTSALDAVSATGLLDLLRELRARTGISVLLISHDLGVIARLCDRVSVIAHGEVVEESSVQTLFSAPRHPYTELLVRSIYVPGREDQRASSANG